VPHVSTQNTFFVGRLRQCDLCDLCGSATSVAPRPPRLCDHCDLCGAKKLTGGRPTPTTKHGDVSPVLEIRCGVSLTCITATTLRGRRRYGRPRRNQATKALRQCRSGHRPDVELPRTATVAVVCRTSAHFLLVGGCGSGASAALAALRLWRLCGAEKLTTPCHPPQPIAPPIIQTIKHKTF
jgi:hypothetical protein